MSSENQDLKKEINHQPKSDQENFSMEDEFDLDDLDFFKPNEFGNSALLADHYKNSSDDSNELSHEQKLERLEQFKMEVPTKSLQEMYPYPLKDAHELRTELQELRSKVLNKSREEIDDALPNRTPQTISNEF